MVRNIKPTQSKLMDIWYAAVEAKAAYQALANPDYSKPILEIALETPDAATWTRFELYKLRDKARANNRRGLEPDDPNYGKSPFDPFKLSIHDNKIQIHLEDFTPFNFEIIQTIELPPDTPKKERKKRSPKTLDDST